MDLTIFEPESNLLLGILNTVRTMADIPSNVNCIVPCVRRQNLDLKHEEERDGVVVVGGGRWRNKKN